MSYPICEQVAQLVLAAMETIKVSGGYGTNAIVERKLRYNRERDGLIVLHQLDPTRRGDPEQLQMHHEWDFPFVAICYVVEPEGSLTPIDRRINIVRSDVEKAIMTAFGQTAPTSITYARMGDPATIDDPEGRWFGVAVPFTMYYRTLFNDPYSGG